jgi:hypothetical protein
MPLISLKTTRFTTNSFASSTPNSTPPTSNTASTPSNIPFSLLQVVSTSLLLAVLLTVWTLIMLLLQFLRISLLDVWRLPPLIARTQPLGSQRVDAAIQAAFMTPTKRTVPHNSRARSNRARRNPPPKSPPIPTIPTAGPSHHCPQRGLRGRGAHFTTRGAFPTRNSRPSTLMMSLQMV